MPDNAWLFSYGTLRQANVQSALFGREVESIRDALAGFELDFVTITDPSVIEKSGSDRHPIMRRSANERQVEGSVLWLTQLDLEAVARYEAADYVRVPVTTIAGRLAFAYIHRDEIEQTARLGRS